MTKEDNEHLRSLAWSIKLLITIWAGVLVGATLRRRSRRSARPRYLPVGHPTSSGGGLSAPKICRGVVDEIIILGLIRLVKSQKTRVARRMRSRRRIGLGWRIDVALGLPLDHFHGDAGDEIGNSLRVLKLHKALL